MKTLIRFILVQLCCLPLLVTDAMAREASRGNGGRASARPSVRPASSSAKRNPITHSKVSRPAPRPQASPQRPTTRPAQVTRPTSKPATRPNIPERPTTRPSPTRPDRPDAGGANARPALPNGQAERPGTRPEARPGQPTTRPAPGNPNRPGAGQGPSTLPATPGKRPELPNRPETRPTTRPGNVTYPQPNRPTTLPGTVNRPGENANRPGANPNRPGENANRPGVNPNRPGENANRPVGNPNRPGQNINRPNNPNRPNQPSVQRPGQNSRPIKKPNLNRPNNTVNNINNVNVNNIHNNTQINNRPNNNWWDAGRPGQRPNNNRPGYNNNNNHWGNNIHNGNTNIQINNNFQNNVNWSTNRNNWGYNPWWNRPATRPWYGGSWNCGWSSSYYHRTTHYHSHVYYGGYRPLPGYVVYEDNNDVAEAIGWGLVGWSLGKLIFDSGYHSYSNPYPAQPVPSAKGSPVTYTQPITVVAAQTAPPDAEAAKMTEASESHIAESQDAFKQGDYLKALDSANKAVGEAPGDGALHEYRALVLFSLGKFSEAAGVLNPVLAGGPGWDWTTMISLYNAQETYMKQLTALESYAKAKPDAADARFLLGYHYMVCGHLEQASAEFAAAAKLQPADSVSSQLRDLTAASSNNGESDAAKEAEAPAEALPPPPAPVPLEKLTGTWVSDKGAQGTVTLAFKEDGKFIWTFKKDDKSNEFGGDFSMNDNGLLVLDAEESQMVAAVTLPQDSELKFVLAGGPPGDTGLVFAKK